MAEERGLVQSAVGNFIALASDGSTASVIVSVVESMSPRAVGPDELAAAQQLLDALPLDDTPGPAPPSANSRLLLRRNPLFVGRKSELQTVARELKAGHTVAITGPGGMGKTELANEFAHRYGRYFAGGVFWLRFSDAEAIPEEIAACGGPGYLGLYQEAHRLTLKEQWELVLRSWREELPRLLVFDGCQNEDLLERWRPLAGGCRLVVTSRRGRWSAALGVTILPLGELTRRDGVSLLRQHRSDLRADNSDLAAIVDELGGHPLSLNLAGRYLAEYRDVVTPASYLAKRHPIQDVGGGVSTTKREPDVGSAFALSYERLEPGQPIDALALAILGRAAWFAAGEPIRRDLLLATLMETDGDDLRRADALNKLVSLGLLEETRAGLRMHRQIVAFVRDVHADPSARDAVWSTLLDEADRVNQAGYPQRLAHLRPHLDATLKEVKDRNDRYTATTFRVLGRHLYQFGAYDEALPYLKQSLEVWEMLVGPDDPETATSLNDLARLMHARGQYAEARAFYERTLTIRERALGRDDPATATTLNDLAKLLHAEGSYTGAEGLYRRALKIRNETLGSSHPDTAGTLNDLALLLFSQRKYAEARRLYERALEIRRKSLGEDHPDTFAVRSNLAMALTTEREYAGAEVLYEQALSASEAALGAGHPTTGSILNGYAVLLNTQGKYRKARELYERSLEIRESRLGPDHPVTALAHNNLAVLLVTQEEYAEAAEHLKRAIESQDRGYRVDHPLTALYLSNFGALLSRQHRLRDSQTLFEEALAIRERVPGGNHLDTASALHNLAVVLARRGRHGKATPLYERALAIRERVLGPTHPQTANTGDSLVLALLLRGRFVRAWQLRRFVWMNVRARGGPALAWLPSARHTPNVGEDGQDNLLSVGGQLRGVKEPGPRE